MNLILGIPKESLCLSLLSNPTLSDLGGLMTELDVSQVISDAIKWADSCGCSSDSYDILRNRMTVLMSLLQAQGERNGNHTETKGRPRL